MRLVIDLQACQHGSNHDAALEQARQLVRAAGRHEVWIALNGALPARIDLLRAAFAGLLPAGRVRVYELPPAAETAAPHAPWLARAAELVRDSFLISLAPDLVYAPALFDGTAVALSPARPDPRLLTAFSLASAGVLEQPAGDSPEVQQTWQRQRGCLASAGLLVAANAALARQLDGAGAARVAALKDEPSSSAAAAQLWRWFGEALAQRAASGARAPARRPRLAYLSPLPPEKSGIADYSADVIPALAQYYDIDVIAEQDGIADSYVSSHFPLRSVAWFEANAGRFDRIVYHFGNNPMHGYMFELLRRHPGVVILHDFYLSGVVDWLDHSGGQPGNFPRALYHSHGYTGLQHIGRHGRTDAIWRYPANLAVLEHATGVIVHSEFARQLAARWYGPGAADDWQVVTLPRRPQPHASDAGRRAAARLALRLEDGDFMVCSFGMLGATKLNAELIDAFLASPLGADPRCKLVFVGQASANGYGAEMRDKIAASAAADRILITGFVAPALYADYAAAADVAVQLRSMTRGETSAAILDCLLYGAATVINAHGAGADLSENYLVKLPDQFSVQQLADALARLRNDPALRARLGRAAFELVRREHAPAASARDYHGAIERFAQHHPRQEYRALNGALARLPGAAAVPVGELLGTARAIAWNQPPQAPRQLFVDISAMVESDLKTGIQRVVRSVLKALIDTPPAGYRVEPVWGNGGGRPYRYARQYMLNLLGMPELALEDAPIDTRPGDIFLGLDLYTNGTAQNQDVLRDMRRRGVAVHFVLYDVLPMLRPDWFPYGTDHYFADYLDTLLDVADGVACISRSVADQFAAWSANRDFTRHQPLQLGWFHLGADIDASKPSFGLTDNAEQVFAAVEARPTLLMVGTLEPRKGHTQALDAFELLWQKNREVNLVIVGKAGWMVDALVKRLDGHIEAGKRLFWLQGASDEMLQKLYRQASGLLAASEGEGFGLPLIEAAQHRIPILARDIPVFREVAGEHAHYFKAAVPSELAATLEQWFALHHDGKAAGSADMPWLTWDGSARQLVRVICEQNWYRPLSPGGAAEAAPAAAPAPVNTSRPAKKRK